MFAGLALVDGDAVRAIKLCGAAAVLRERQAAPLQDTWQQRRTKVVIEPARAAAGEQAEKAWAHGARLSVEEAVSYALNGTAAG